MTPVENVMGVDDKRSLLTLDGMGREADDGVGRLEGRLSLNELGRGADDGVGRLVGQRVSETLMETLEKNEADVGRPDSSPVKGDVRAIVAVDREVTADCDPKESVCEVRWESRAGESLVLMRIVVIKVNMDVNTVMVVVKGGGQTHDGIVVTAACSCASSWFPKHVPPWRKLARVANAVAWIVSSLMLIGWVTIQVVVISYGPNSSDQWITEEQWSDTNRGVAVSY